MPERKYGWKPDLPDHRDRKFSLDRRAVAPGVLPRSVDLRAKCAPIYDQGSLGSCTAQAVAAAMEFCKAAQELPHITPSRLFIYYNERAMSGTVAVDAGASIRDSVHAVVQWGACDEVEWPYDIDKFAVQPPHDVYATAGLHQAIEYLSIDQDLDQLRGCLAAGFPILFGFTVYQSFEGPIVAQTGIMDYPKPFERALGGHAVMAIGYDDDSQHFVVRNSWGAGWGAEGNFFMPYPYIASGLACDFWTLRTVE